MNFVFCFADSKTEWNTSEWRSRIPSDGINTHPSHESRCIPIGDFANYGHPSIQSIVGRADVIIVQRNLLTADIWEACDYWRGIGKTVVADLDDDYPHLLPQNPAFRFWIMDHNELKEKTGYTPIEALTEGFKHVDALVSPNELILEDWADVVPGYWVPNYARSEWYKGIKQKPIGDEIIIGWGGSISHWDGFWFSGLREAVPTILEKYPNVTWKICGGDVRVKTLFDELAPGRWIDQDGVPPNDWPKQVASFDIGIAPLCGPGSEQGERYDLRRSWLKAVEYLLTGVPWMASEGIVYEKLDDKGGHLIENTPESWTEALCDIIDNLGIYKKRSKKLMPWARKTLLMEHNVNEYVAVFERINTERNATRLVRLPNVLYSKDFFAQVEEKEPGIVDVPITSLETLIGYQRETFKIATSWYHELDLVWRGVNMGECVEFPMLHILNTSSFEEVGA